MRIKTCTYEGQFSDGTSLEPGKLYFARFNGALDEHGGERETPDAMFKKYKAVKTGSLFAMRLHPEYKWYHLPQYFDYLPED